MRSVVRSALPGLSSPSQAPFLCISAGDGHDETCGLCLPMARPELQRNHSKIRSCAVVDCRESSRLSNDEPRSVVFTKDHDRAPSAKVRFSAWPRECAPEQRKTGVQGGLALTICQRVQRRRRLSSLSVAADSSEFAAPLLFCNHL